jgi:hypothetical protein
MPPREKVPHAQIYGDNVVKKPANPGDDRTGGGVRPQPRRQAELECHPRRVEPKTYEEDRQRDRAPGSQAENRGESKAQQQTRPADGARSGIARKIPATS